MECPHISKGIVADKFNKPVNYEDFGGIDYVFYDHTDPDGKIISVQFCQLVGRKKDVFECLNENEWQNCQAFNISKERRE